MIRADTKPNDRIWLVKSAGQVLGPFSWLELAESIETRKVSLIDEVRDPWSRWGFVREHPQLQDLVKKIREYESNTTDITTNTEKTRSDITITQEITPIPEMPPAQRHYGLSTDRKVQLQVKNKNALWRTLVWTVSLVVIGAVIGIYIFTNPRQSDSLGFEDYMRLAKQHQSLGVYNKALSFYRKAENLRPLDLSSRLQMIPLLLNVDNQVHEARKWIDQLVEQGLTDKKTQVELNNLRGLTYLKEGNLKFAEEEFQKALSVDPQFYPAVANLITTHMLMKKYQDVILEVAELEKNSKIQIHLELTRAMAMMQILPTPCGADCLAVIKTLEDYLQKNSMFRAEVQMVLVALNFFSNRADNAKDQQKLLFDMVPDQTKDVVLELNIDYQVLSWPYLKNICEWTSARQHGSNDGMGLLSLCQYASGDVKSAFDTLEQLRKQDPKDLDWINLESYFLHATSQTDRASALVKNFAGQMKLMNLVKGELCLDNKDLVCAESAFKSVLEVDEREVRAYWGLARVQIERNQKANAKSTVRQGLQVMKKYRPLIELREEIGEI